MANKGERVPVTIRMEPTFHEKLKTRVQNTGHSIQGLAEHLLRRWLDGDLDRKTDRPISPTESAEDSFRKRFPRRLHFLFELLAFYAHISDSIRQRG